MQHKQSEKRNANRLTGSPEPVSKFVKRSIKENYKKIKNIKETVQNRMKITAFILVLMVL